MQLASLDGTSWSHITSCGYILPSTHHTIYRVLVYHSHSGRFMQYKNNIYNIVLMFVYRKYPNTGSSIWSTSLHCNLMPLRAWVSSSWNAFGWLHHVQLRYVHGIVILLSHFNITILQWEGVDWFELLVLCKIGSSSIQRLILIFWNYHG